MLRSLGDPHRVPDFVHIGGTNGKGSTAALVDSVLRQAGRSTGLYTSPHLSDFAERIRIDGEPAHRDLMETCAGDVLALAEREDASFFESATVLAFEAFRRAGCDTVVLEVGLGGRLDATNVVEPRVTVITSVDLDHADYLGGTLEEIASEKAGIVKPGIPVIAGSLRTGPLGVVADVARDLRAPLDVLGREFLADDVSVSLAGTQFVYRSDAWADGLRVTTCLVGTHQAGNAAIAIRSLEKVDFGVSREDIAAGVEGTRWPGRFEVIDLGGECWVLDIAHNPEASRILAGLIQDLPLPRPVVLLLSILGDKPWADMLGPLLVGASAGVLTIAPSSPEERRWRPDQVLAAAGGARAEVELDFCAAMTRARELAGKGTVIVTGSAHTVGDARSLLMTSTEWESP